MGNIVAVDCGPVKRWQEGNILWASNDFITMAYVEADDPRKVGHLGWEGPDEICVQYIGPKEAALWRR